MYCGEEDGVCSSYVTYASRASARRVRVRGAVGESGGRERRSIGVNARSFIESFVHRVVRSRVLDDDDDDDGVEEHDDDDDGVEEHDDDACDGARERGDASDSNVVSTSSTSNGSRAGVGSGERGARGGPDDFEVLQLSHARAASRAVGAHARRASMASDAGDR
jgi:hypothetical protein